MENDLFQDHLAQLIKEFGLTEKEVAEAFRSWEAQTQELREGEAPTRPENHPSQSASPGWTSDPSMEAQQRSANRRHEHVNSRYEDLNASIDAQQTTEQAPEAGVQAEPAFEHVSEASQQAEPTTEPELDAQEVAEVLAFHDAAAQLLDWGGHEL